jgi:hypothetical protein
MSAGKKLSYKILLINSYFIVELDLVCPEIDADDFSPSPSMYILSKG